MAIECSVGNIKLSTDHYEIIDSGCVIVPFGESLYFDLPGNLKFKIVFEKNPDGEQEPVSFHTKLIENGSMLQLSIFNVENINLGTPKKTVELAKLADRILCLNFAFQSINRIDDSEDRIFFYTWFLKK